MGRPGPAGQQWEHQPRLQPSPISGALEAALARADDLLAERKPGTAWPGLCSAAHPGVQGGHSVPSFTGEAELQHPPSLTSFPQNSLVLCGFYRGRLGALLDTGNTTAVIAITATICLEPVKRQGLCFTYLFKLSIYQQRK